MNIEQVPLSNTSKVEEQVKRKIGPLRKVFWCILALIVLVIIFGVGLDNYFSMLKKGLREGHTIIPANDTSKVYILGINHNQTNPPTDDTLKPALETMIYYRVPTRELITQQDFCPELTDKSLVYVGKLTWLQDLDLHGWGITDEGLKSLQGMDELKELDISWTAVTDNGLEHLISLQQLKILRVHHASVSSTGLHLLMQKIPSLNNEEMKSELEELRELEKNPPENNPPIKRGPPPPITQFFLPRTIHSSNVQHLPVLILGKF